MTSRLPQLPRRGIFAALLTLCLTLVPAATSNARSLSPSAAPAPLVHLPADQAAHSNVKNEWWYVVGHLRSGRRTFGYEMTIFKFIGVKPPGFNSTLSIFRTDIAITDENGHRFYHEITPYFPQSAVYSTHGLSIQVGNARLRGSSLGHMSLKASLPAGSFNLTLSSKRRPMYVGGRGYLPFGTGYTYYYSLTDLATSGTLTLHHHRFVTTGISWLDHQWGDWSWKSISGWTWMCLQLDNGVQLSAFDFRGYGRRTRAASVLRQNGSLVTDPGATITPGGAWVSPHTAGRYPAGVTVHVPSVKATLSVRPTLADQEVVWPLEVRGSYWEGSSRVSGTYDGKRVSGDAYLELTGYARG